MPNGDALFAAPSRISNRALIKRMKQWGWHEGKTKNGVTEMHTPSGQVVEVMAATHHQMNKGSTIDAILDAMGVSWKEFVSFDFADQELTNLLLSVSSSNSPEEATSKVRTYLLKRQLQTEVSDYVQRLTDAVQMNGVKQSRREQRRMEREQREAKRAEAVVENHVKGIEAEPYAVSAKASEGDAIPVGRLKDASIREDNTVRVETDDGDVAVIGVPFDARPETWETARHVDRVLTYLMDAGAPVPLAKMAEDIGRSRAQIGGACSYLKSLGLVKRVKHGVYSIEPTAMKRSVGVDVMHHGEAAALTSPPAAPAPSAPPLTPAAPLPAPVPVYATETDESVINDVLDLMFPNGFKAKHLPLIDRWRKATTDLMAEIGKG